MKPWSFRRALTALRHLTISGHSLDISFPPTRQALQEKIVRYFVRYFARFTASTKPRYGSTAFPFHHSFSGPSSKIAKWRCGVRGSAFPVDPTKPMTSPRSTRIPSRNLFVYRYQRLRDSAPRLAMRAATQSAQINDHRDQQPQKIDSRRRHASVQFPCVYDRGERQENEAEYRQHQTTVECALQVGREVPHQRERDARKQQNDEQEEARHSQSQAGQHEQRRLGLDIELPWGLADAPWPPGRSRFRPGSSAWAQTRTHAR